ncbi:hypothetical protein FFLO_05806 [Filobasidium floriforme]|uniref:Uncharacterized protein n=1 Tax=Filobasidium floriforme TaxID=5210 RepID=A0A8K0JHJ4_9TREE|nr:hypothetical protein FFLO_05806 [Filobasidium floriforme]
MGHIKVIILGLATNLASWVWPILNADERDYAILKQILVTLPILGAITMSQVNFPDGMRSMRAIISSHSSKYQIVQSLLIDLCDSRCSCL